MSTAEQVAPVAAPKPEADVELDKRAIANQLEQAAVMGCDIWLDHFKAAAFQPRQRAYLVGAHQLGIADNVRRHDRSKSPLNAFFRHPDGCFHIG